MKLNRRSLAETALYTHALVRQQSWGTWIVLGIGVVMGTGIGFYARTIVSPLPKPHTTASVSVGSPVDISALLKQSERETDERLRYELRKEFADSLKYWSGFLEMEDGIATTVLNKRTAVSGPGHFTALGTVSYPILGYVTNQDRSIGMGVAGEYGGFSFPFICRKKQNPVPLMPKRLLVESGRNVVLQ